jgi:hypothetical protein
MVTNDSEGLAASIVRLRKGLRETGFCKIVVNTRGADKSLALWRKQQATGVKKCIYIFPLSSTHL